MVSTTTAVTGDITHGRKAMATSAMPKPASPITKLAMKMTRAPIAQARLTRDGLRRARVAPGAHAALVRAEALPLLVEITADVDHPADDEVGGVAGLAGLTGAVDPVPLDLLAPGVGLTPRRARQVVLGAAAREDEQSQQRDPESHGPSWRAYGTRSRGPGLPMG